MEIIRIDTVKTTSEDNPGVCLLEVVTYATMQSSPLIVTSGNIFIKENEAGKMAGLFFQEVSRALVGFGFPSSAVEIAEKTSFEIISSGNLVEQTDEMQAIQKYSLPAIRVVLGSCANLAETA